MNKPTKIILLSLALLMILNSCGTDKKFVTPTYNTEGLYDNYSDTASPDAQPNFGTLSWTTIFPDTNLQNLVRCAINDNTDLRIARLKVEQAETALNNARLALLPSFNIPLQGSISSWGQDNTIQTYTLPLSASWEIDVFGRLRNEKRRSRAVLEQSKEYEQAMQTAIVSTVSNTYYSLLMLDAQLDITRQTTEIWAENVKTMQALKQAGMVNESAVSQTEANYYSIMATLPDLKKQIYEVENTLYLLMAKKPDTIIRSQLFDWELKDEIRLGVPAELLSNRPDIRYAESNVMQAFYATASAKAELYPNIVLNGNLGWTNNAGGNILNPATILASAVGSLTQPIFNAGVIRSKVKIAASKQEEAILNYEQAILNAGNEVINALKQIESASEKKELRNRQIAALEATVKSTELLMKHGNTTYLEVLTAQQSLLSARLSAIADQFQSIQGTINLYHALGGGIQIDE